MNGHVECAIFLIEKKAKIDIKSEEGYTALDYANMFYDSSQD
jgi:hypothetical protein